MQKVYQSFDVGFFDLIIADESHRSIYNVYGDRFHYFDCLQIGLTATPIDFVSRNTFSLFGCEGQLPTANYDLEQAVQDGFLTPFEVFEHTTQFLREGIRLDILTKAQIQELEEQGEDPAQYDFSSEQIDKIIYNKDIRRKREHALTLADHFLRSVFLVMFGRTELPNPALRTRPLGEICGLFAGNSLPSGESFSGQEGGHLLLKVGDLNLPGNEQTIMSAREWLSEKARTGPAIVAPKDAIVFPKRGGAIATNKKRVLGRPCILDPNLMAVAPKPSSPVSYPFLRVWFELLDLSSISNGSTVPQLNKGDLYPLEIPIPDKANLLAFDRLFHGVNRVRERQADDLLSAEALFSSLSQRAFRGEL